MRQAVMNTKMSLGVCIETDLRRQTGGERRLKIVFVFKLYYQLVLTFGFDWLNVTDNAL
jgi:hypothetical protein